MYWPGMTRLASCESPQRPIHKGRCWDVATHSHQPALGQGHGRGQPSHGPLACAGLGSDMGRGWRSVAALRPFAITGRHCHKSSLQVPHLRADVGGGVLGPVPAPPQHRTSSTRPHRFARMVHAPPAPLRPAGTSWTGALGTHSYPRSRGSSMADATAGSSRAVARARPTAARRPRDVRVEMVIVVGQEEEEVAWLRRVGWVVRGRARARNPLPAMQRAGPKRSGDACWPCGVCPGVIGCGLCSVGS